MKVYRWTVKFSASFASTLALLAVSGGLSSAAEVNRCTFDFDAVAEMAHGTIAIGDKLRGRMSFKLGGIKERGDTRYYHATGEISVSQPDQGTISGEVKYVHVTRSPHVADYVTIGARETKGNLGGVNLNFDPMIVSLYGKRGMLSAFDLPRSTAGWNAFAKKRVFQYHSPVAHRAVLYRVGGLIGSCD